MVETKDYPEGITFEPKDQIFSFFGTQFSVTWLRYTLTQAKLVTDVSVESIKKKELVEQGIEIEWIGAEDAELIISSTYPVSLTTQ
jgi:hypothetical protein